MRRFALASVLALVSLPVAAQTVQLRSLGKLDVEYSEPFTQLGSVRELRDGRVLVLDVRDRVLQLLDARFSSATPVGREGRGPGEYAMPAQLIAARADTTLVYDPGAARFLVLDQAAKPVTTIPLASLTGAATGGRMVVPTAIRGMDSRGRLYYQTMSVVMGPNGPALPDSAAIFRLDLSTQTVDTVAKVAVPKPGMQMSGTPATGMNVRMQPPVFPTVDEWTMLADGTVAIARGATFRIDWVSGSLASSSTAPVPYTAVRVTEADKEEYRKAQRQALQIVNRAMGDARAAAGASGGSAPMPTLKVDDPDAWPDHKPPFGPGAVLAAPDGMLWIALSRPAGEAPLYNVVDRSGKLRSRVTLPKRSAIIGFGATGVYVVRIDDDDLQYLQRYRY